MVYPLVVINPDVNFQFVSELRKTEKGFETDWEVPAALPYFEGHFPDQPILPGIAILDATLVLVKLIERNQSLRLLSVRNAKFLQLIKPGMKIRIELAKLSDSKWKAQWLISSGEQSRVSLVELDFDTGNG